MLHKARYVFGFIIIVVCVCAFCLCFAGHGTVESVYKETLAGKTIDTVYFYVPRDESVNYRLKDTALATATEYILSLKIRSAFPQRKYSGDSYDWLDLSWISLVSNSNDLPSVFLSIILVDAETVVICKDGISSGHAYRLAEPFDLDYFLSLFTEA